MDGERDIETLCIREIILNSITNTREKAQVHTIEYYYLQNYQLLYCTTVTYKRIIIRNTQISNLKNER
jgi:hypothetical protein